MTSSAGRGPGDRGSGLVATSFGLAFFLAFLLAAVQLLVYLHASSVVEAVTEDAAARAARSVPRAQVEAEARAALGSLGDGARFTWTDDGDRLRLRVETDGRTISPLGALLGADHVDAEASVRAEVVR